MAGWAEDTAPRYFNANDDELTAKIVFDSRPAALLAAKIVDDTATISPLCRRGDGRSEMIVFGAVYGTGSPSCR